MVWLTAMGSAFTTLIGSFDSPAALAVASALCAAFVWQLRSMFGTLGNFSLLSAVVFPLQLVVFFAVFFRSLWVTLVRRRVRWRGRDVPVRRAPAASGEVMQ